jgi:RNA polymerase sigma factor FliA
MDIQLQENEELWQQYLSKPTAKCRDTLINKYSQFAIILAAKFYANRQVLEIEFDEFKQLSMVGLIESIDRYNPSMGASFKTYASHRIKGAILDGIEKYSEKQQQITARSRLRTERMQNLLETATLHQKDIFARLADIAVGTAIGYMLEDSAMYQINEEVVSEYSVYRRREVSDLSRIMGMLVVTLPKQEEQVIRLHYFQQMKFDQIAQELQITKGRVSQIHHSALKKMYEHYDELKLLRTDY